MKKIRTLLTVFLFLTFGGGIGWLWYYLHLPSSFPIRTVKVIGDYQFIDPETLEKVVMPYVSRGFFNVPVQATDAALSEIPGVSQSSLKRRWPDKVEIRVIEKQAEAVLPDGEIYATDGTIFKPGVSRNLSQLPIFAGALEDLPAIKSFYHAAKFLLMKQGFQINYVGCDGLSSWTLGVTHNLEEGSQKVNMTIILGQNHLIEKLTRFMDHYSMLEQTNGGKIPTSVDLRYTLGFSAQYSQKVT